MERLSVSESISKIVGHFLKQRWLEDLQTVGSLSKYNRFKLARQQLKFHMHHAFLSVAIVARLCLEMSHVL